MECVAVLVSREQFGFACLAVRLVLEARMLCLLSLTDDTALNRRSSRSRLRNVQSCVTNSPGYDLLGLISDIEIVSNVFSNCRRLWHVHDRCNPTGA